VARPAIAEEVMRRRPDARHLRLGGVGHYPQWEAPDQVAAAMLGAAGGPSSSTI
jgi:pimeloyl-ACP methyl ester carboxylesterase